MPLIKSASKKALKKNIETEMHANPAKADRAQNLAIAYNVMRKNKRKMADGGEVTESSKDPMEMDMMKRPDDMKSQGKEATHEMRANADDQEDEMSMRMRHQRELAAGGFIGESDHATIDDSMDSMEMDMEHQHEDMSNQDLMEAHMDQGDRAARIMGRMKKGGDLVLMAEGGEVDLDENAKEHDNMEDDLSFEALKKENYSEDDALMDQPEDSNEHGRDLSDEDEKDGVSRIMKKIRK